MASSLSSKRTRYSQGGVTEVFPNRLGWWERTIMPHTNTDIQYVVPSYLGGNPWGIANEIYGSDQYAWLVLQYNTILDIQEELAVGKTILLPSPERVL
jgi:hypothetical protein